MKLLEEFLSVMIQGLVGQPFVVHIVISFIILEGLGSYCIIKYLLNRIAELQREQRQFMKMSRYLMHSKIYQGPVPFEEDLND